MNREWKIIKGYDNYEISNDGIVRNAKTLKILSQSLEKSTACEEYKRYIIKLKNKHNKIHRLVAEAFVENPENKPEVDHIDGDSTNNHYTNLRWATRKEQMRNTKKPVNNTSGVKGVSWKSDRKKWKAFCSVNKKQYHFGYFDDRNEAEKAVTEGRKKLHGEYGRQE
jgi:hypothetical protein